MSIPSPLLDSVRRGDAPADVRLLAAQAAIAPRAHEQAALLAHLCGDGEATVRDAAEDTLRQVPPAALAAAVASPDTAVAVREFFAARGVTPAGALADPDAPLIERHDPSADAAWQQAAMETAPVAAGATRDTTGAAAGAQDAAHAGPAHEQGTLLQRIQRMHVADRIKAAMRGTRELRAILIRDSNKLVAAAVLSSPKVGESEIEGFARMTTVSDDILRTIGGSRTWTRHYGIVQALTRNPKTPIAISLQLLPRLNDRDVNALSIDRNVPDPLRAAARRRVVAATSRR